MKAASDTMRLREHGVEGVTGVKARTLSFAYEDALTLNLAPIHFSSELFEAGRTPYQDDIQYRELRETHRKTHVFRYDARDGMIYDVPVAAGAASIGASSRLETKAHLALLGKALGHALLAWLAPSRTILRRARPLQCWGDRKAALLTAAIREFGQQERRGLEVLVRHSFDFRVMGAPHQDAAAYLALSIDVSTSNELDVSVAQLMRDGFDPIGLYVCAKRVGDPDDPLFRLETIGRVVGSIGGRLHLGDAVGDDQIDAREVFLEPRQSNLEAVVNLYYPDHATSILRGLARRRGPYSTANDKLAKLRHVHGSVAARLADVDVTGMKVRVGALLQRGDPLFPLPIATDRPGFLFGAQGRETGAYPDAGVKRHGPYKYMQHERNEPVVAIVCESRFRGRMDQLARTLRDGVADDAWRDATRSRRRTVDNPFQGGLVGKLRLSRVLFEFEELSEPTPDGYRKAIERLLTRLPEPPDLALVQTRESFRTLRKDLNPYLASKAAFMTAGVPVQSIKAETADMRLVNLAYTINNLALASYAKLGGTPFVISTRMPATHELIVGLGYAETSEGRFGPKSRFVGITTLFQGDGRYLVWGQTREVEFEHYADALLASLKGTIDLVRRENNWQARDRVRLVFHVYKPLKHVEIDAIKRLVNSLLEGHHEVEFAFLDLSHHHDLAIFDPTEHGVEYYMEGMQLRKGIGVPTRGLGLQLDDHSALLQLIGAREVKTEEQGLPRPLRLTLHRDSDFRDMTYLTRQAFSFSYLSWRSYFPAVEPVSILYSRLIANALANLRGAPAWNSAVLTAGSLRNRLWFL